MEVGYYLRRFHFSFCPFSFLGTCPSVLPLRIAALHNELEKYVANFVGKPAAIVFGMGYVTNSAIIPAMIGKVCAVNQ
jgi:7-keto-8-aminopelargonate synthetase-like enzyme